MNCGFRAGGVSLTNCNGKPCTTIDTQTGASMGMSPQGNWWETREMMVECGSLTGWTVRGGRDGGGERQCEARESQVAASASSWQSGLASWCDTRELCQTLKYHSRVDLFKYIIM